MKMLIGHKRLGSLIALMVIGGQLFYAATASGQIVENWASKRDAGYPSARVLRFEGWTVPLTDDLAGGSPKTVDWDGIPVEGRVMTRPEKLVDFEGFYVNANGDIRISSQKCLVPVVTAYEVKNRRFAYRALYNPVAIETSGEITTLGALMIAYFLDSNGDGVFEERVQANRPPSMPEWARSLVMGTEGK